MMVYVNRNMSEQNITVLNDFNSSKIKMIYVRMLGQIENLVLLMHWRTTKMENDNLVETTEVLHSSVISNFQSSLNLNLSTSPCKHPSYIL